MRNQLWKQEIGIVLLFKKAEGRKEGYKEKKKGARIFEEGRLKREDVKMKNRN